VSVLRGRAATAAALLLLLALTIWYAGDTPAATSATQAASEFSLSQALRHVGEMTQRPHPVGSADHDRVRDYVATTLASYGAEVEVQHATGVGTRYAVAGRIANVIGRVPGALRGGPFVLLASHYDGVPGGPAAGDDAAATAALLETVRALRAGPPLRHDVMILVTDAEEAGLLGAAAFVRDHPLAKNAGVVINFEARGTRGPSLMFETGRGNLDVVRVLRGIGGARASSLSTAVYRRLPNDTDLSEFALLDKPALNFAFIGGVNRYHTAQDDVQHLSKGSLLHHGQQALALARAFGSDELPRPATTDGVFFDLPLLGVVVYPEGWSIGFALLAVALLVVATIRSRQPESRLLRDFALSVGMVLGTVTISGLLGWGLSFCLDRLHDALASGEPMWSTVYAAAIALAVVALTSAAYRIARIKASAAGIRLGVLWVWTILSVALVFVAPGASFLLLWPATAASAAMLVETFVGRRVIGELPAWAAAAVVLSFLAPTSYLMVCLALGIAPMGAVILSVLAGLTTWLLAPQLEMLATTHANGTAGPVLDWRAPAVAGVASLALLLLGSMTVRTTTADPAGAQIHYVVEADSSRAWLTGTGTTLGADQWIVRSVRRIAGNKPAPLVGWMRQRLDSTRTAPVPFVALPAPSVSVMRDSLGADARHVVLRVRPGPANANATNALRPYMVVLSMPREAVVRAAVDGKAIDTARYRSQSRSWRLDYVAPPDSGFTLALTLKPDAKREIDVGTRTLSIPPLGAVQLPQRPAGIVTIQTGNFSTVYRRVVF
jgi:hypothetical protein